MRRAAGDRSNHGLASGKDYIVGINPNTPNGGFMPLTPEAKAYLEQRNSRPEPR